MSVILLLTQLQHPFTAASSIIPVFYSRVASGERLNEIEELTQENISDKTDVSIYCGLEEIVFQDVGFSYGRETVLRGVSSTIRKGEIVCLTGASGSGKSTLFKLLLHVYTPTEGSISLRGDFGNAFSGVRELPLTEKERSLFAYVPQGKFLFSGTIYENLTFFLDDKDGLDVELRIKNALDVACAQFVWDLPQGLQTPLLENGVGLSEGQMQRLAVARAILSDRPILLLDEATSALDTQTELTLLENVRALKNKTCLIVTHRPAALSIADKILSVENGKIYVKENEL